MVKFAKPVVYGSFVGTCFAGILYIKDYFGGAKYEGKEQLEGKTVIVTGANTGIGEQVTLELAKRKAKVIMACRDIEKCEKAREKIVLSTMNKYVYCRFCDLASQSSVRKFAERFKKEHERLDILINNAGVMRCPRLKTEEGIELQLGVNHMSHFLLTNLLLDRLKQSAPSRIIVVSSTAHKRGKINKTDLNSDKEYDEGTAYSQSKLANILFTRELAKRLEGSGVTVNAVHPGIVNTEITRHMGFYNSFAALIFVKPFMWLFAKTPLQGAQTVLYASLSPDLDKITGKYFSDCTETEVAPDGQDDKTALWLWLVSEKWTRLSL